jgi:hypothetical protein
VAVRYGRQGEHDLMALSLTRRYGSLLPLCALLVCGIGCRPGGQLRYLEVTNKSNQVIYVNADGRVWPTPIPPRSTVVIGKVYASGSQFRCEILDSTSRRAKSLRLIDLRDEELYSRDDGTTLHIEYSNRNEAQ